MGIMRKPCGIVALLTDFGISDPYVASMKGVLLDICRSSVLIDITHQVAPFDIEYGSFVLLSSYRYFPLGTVFIAVVDPGVGSPRRPIAIASRNYYFVGPDNGLLVPAAQDDGLELAVMLDRDEFYRKPTSHSFHGRDVFAPIAARLSCGQELESLGTPIDPGTLIRPRLHLGLEKADSCVRVWVVHIDRFGNAVLSERFSKIGRELEVDFGSKVEIITKLRRAEALIEKVFSVAPPGGLVLYENSFGYAELAVNLDSAASILSISRGDEVLICGKP